MQGGWFKSIYGYILYMFGCYLMNRKVKHILFHPSLMLERESNEVFFYRFIDIELSMFVVFRLSSTFHITSTICLKFITNEKNAVYQATNFTFSRFHFSYAPFFIQRNSVWKSRRFYSNTQNSHWFQCGIFFLHHHFSSLDTFFISWAPFVFFFIVVIVGAQITPTQSDHVFLLNDKKNTFIIVGLEHCWPAYLFSARFPNRCLAKLIPIAKRIAHVIIYNRDKFIFIAVDSIIIVYERCEWLPGYGGAMYSYHSTTHYT